MDIGFNSNNKKSLQNKVDENKSHANKQKIPFIKLIQGSTVRGVVVDIQQNKIVIKINNELITANVSELLSASIGSLQEFLVDYDENGKLLLMLKLPKAETMQRDMIVDTLKSLGLKPTEQNIKIAKTLMDNQQAVNKENLQKINQGIKLFGEGDILKALFFVKNEIQINSKNIEILNNLIKGEENLKSHIELLLKNIENLPEPVKSLIYEVLLKDDENKTENKINKQILKENEVTIKDYNKLDLQNNMKNSTKTEIQIKSTENLIQLISKNTNSVKSEIINEMVNEISKNNLSYEKLEEIVKNTFYKLEDIQLNPKDVGIDHKDIEINPKNVEVIIKEIFNDKNVEAFVLNKLNLKESEKNMYQIKDKLTFNPTQTNTKDLENFILDFKNNINKLEEILKLEPETEEIIIIRNSISNTLDKLEFISNIKDIIFMQLPIYVNNHDTNAELFIFKDKNNKKNNTDSVSALIALDTINIGRVEVFLQKNNKNISLNFRLKDESMKKIVNENISNLTEKLEALNYSISNLIFSTLEEPFNVTEKMDKLIEMDLIVKEFEGKIKVDMRI